MRKFLFLEMDEAQLSQVTSVLILQKILKLKH